MIIVIGSLLFVNSGNIKISAFTQNYSKLPPLHFQNLIEFTHNYSKLPLYNTTKIIAFTQDYSELPLLYFQNLSEFTQNYSKLAPCNTTKISAITRDYSKLPPLQFQNLHCICPKLSQVTASIIQKLQKTNLQRVVENNTRRDAIIPLHFDLR